MNRAGPVKRIGSLRSDAWIKKSYFEMVLAVHFRKFVLKSLGGVLMGEWPVRYGQIQRFA